MRDPAECPVCGRPFLVVEEIVAVLPRGHGYLLEVGCTNCGRREIGTYPEAGLAALDASRSVATMQIEAAVSQLVAGPLWTDALAEA